MPHDWDISRRSFVAGGRRVPRREVRASIKRLLDHVGRDASRIARRYDAGKINAAEFNLEMRELLRSGHIVAASVGRGGRARMQPSDWGRVANKIRWQYGYLDRFTRKLEAGTLKVADTRNRARAYANALYTSYARADLAAQTEFVAGGGDRDPDGVMLCRLVQNSEEGCAECEADAADGWMPVTEMGEIGTRICGDFCKCTIEFEDEL